MTAQKVAIVTTADARHCVVESFVKYHLRLGVDRIYLFWDCPQRALPPSVENAPRVRVIRERCSAADVCRALGVGSAEPGMAHPLSQLVGRQIYNGNRALQFAREDSIHWLLHLDMDEAFWCPARPIQRHFEEMAERGIEQVVYLNHEGVPEQVDIDNWFDVTLFKFNPFAMSPESLARLRKLLRLDLPQLPPTFFIHYSNGKASVRVSDEVCLAGVHAFGRRDGRKLVTLRTASPAVLHYSACGLENFRHKYERTGSDPDPWQSKPAAVPLPLHERAKQWLTLAGDARLRDLYRDNWTISDPALATLLLDTGTFIRTTTVRDMTRGDEARGAERHGTTSAL
jgi:hypothetical protein